MEKDYIWNPNTCSCVNGKYLASIIDDSVITSYEIIEETKKPIPLNCNNKKTYPVKQKASISYLHSYQLLYY